MSKKKGPDKLEINNQAGTPKNVKHDTAERQSIAELWAIVKKIGVSAKEAGKILLDKKNNPDAPDERVETSNAEPDSQTNQLSDNDTKPKETFGDRHEILEGIASAKLEIQKTDLIAALTPSTENPEQSLKLQSYALYREIEPWFAVSECPDYRKVKLDLEMILANLNEIIRTVWHKNAKEMRIAEFGPGKGEKIQSIILKLLYQMRLGKLHLGPNQLKHIDLDIADVCGEMMHITFRNILVKIMQQVGNMHSKNLGEDHPWKKFVTFVEEHDKKITSEQHDILPKIERAFYALISNRLKRYDGKPVESIFKFALARYFGFHKTEQKLLDMLDHDLKLPLDIKPHLSTFENLDENSFHSTREKPTLITHLGDEVFNQFPDDAIKNFYAGKMLGSATPFNKKTHEQNIKNGVEDEANINATYILFSFQTGTLDYPKASKEAIDADGNKILPAYNNVPFNYFVSSLFEKPELSRFVNPKTGKAFRNPETGDPDHTQCYDVVAEYAEDPDNPGYYGTTHNLVFNKDVDITITVDKGDTKEKRIFNMKKGQKVFLLASYKPTVAQIDQLCEENDIKVVDVYQDHQDTNAVFLIRAKTDFETEYDRQTKLKIEEKAKEPDKKEPSVETTTDRVRDKLGKFVAKNHKCAA